MRYILMILLALAVTSCATRTGPHTEKQSTTGAATAQQTAPDEPVVTAYIPPATPQYTRPEPSRAVQVLMQRAEDQRRAGQLVSAASSLERALRIDPQNPVLWNQLAHVRLEQGQYERVAGLASKSNLYAAPEDTALRQDNQYLIERSRR